MKSTKWNIIGYSVLILLAMALVLSVSHHDNGTDRKPAPQVVFQGEYKIGDEPWQPIVEGKYISAVRGDITLRGRFLQKLSNETALMLVEPNSEIALFLDHIGGEVYINGELNDIFPAEDPHIGKSSCGKGWVVYKHKGTESDTLEIVLKNPHIFGNATAVNELLRSMCIYTGFSFSEEKAKEGFAEWWIGAAVIITALVLIGVAIFSWLTGLDESDVLWLVGIAVLFEGGYLILDAPNANLWDHDPISFFSNAMQLCMMLYTMAVMSLIERALAPHIRKVGRVAVLTSGVLTGGFVVISLVSNIRLYDTLLFWMAGLTVTGTVLFVCCCLSFQKEQPKLRFVMVALMLVLIAMLVDALGTGVGWWQGRLISKYLFGFIYVIALVTSLRIIPSNIRAGIRESELQAELEKSKTAIMLSQIQPHFLYNSLGAIRSLCRKSPEDARDALTLFIAYLRGNMDSLRSEYPIHFHRELSHIETYLKLEQLRFGDALDVVFDIQADDFFLPCLTVQPLVENAVKHGVCAVEEGGTVTLHTRTEGNNIIITITDDGAGFDMDKNEEHVGIQNVRNRLHYMVGGQLQIESAPGKGTKATITLPIS